MVQRGDQQYDSRPNCPQWACGRHTITVFSYSILLNPIGYVYMLRISILTACLVCAGPVAAQEVSFIHRLGRDTMAVEQFTRTANRVTGEVASRSGNAVLRWQYDVTLGRDGRPVSAIYRGRNAAGAPLPNQPTEIRLTFVGDSVKREAVYADSTNTRMLPAVGGIPYFQPAFGLMEIAFAQLRRSRAPSLQFAAVGTGTNNPNVITLTAAGGDTVRTNTNVVYMVDREGRLLALDATATTNKLQSVRATSKLDIAALAGRMRPAGVLSARGNAHAAFLQSVVFVNYGRPQVRDRTVWGGTLIPYNEVWRTGANEATHLATSRELTFGNVVVPPGLYTLWIYNDRNAGPQLIINKQIGQWGAGPNVYNPANDLGRVPLTLAAAPEHVEEFTITIRNAGGPTRGAIDFAWGDKVATAQFTVRQQ